MPAITIRNLSDSVHATLKQQAALQQLSVEALVRRILAKQTVHAQEPPLPPQPTDHATGFSEASQSWGHEPMATTKMPPASYQPPHELWGALRGTVRVPVGSNLAAPLDEDWDANH
jgi:plasmid stability protein